MIKLDEHSPRLPLNFWSNIEPEPNSGCWLWTSYTSTSGYGMFEYRGKTTSAHRAIWMECFGDIPEKLCICHKCDIRICVNPTHLFLGTVKDNVWDMKRKGRANYLRGDKHPSTLHPENLQRGDEHWTRRRPDLMNMAKGSKAGKAKLKEADVLEIRRLWDEGFVDQADLARMFNISRNNISTIVNLKSWKHI